MLRAVKSLPLKGIQYATKLIKFSIADRTRWLVATLITWFSGGFERLIRHQSKKPYEGYRLPSPAVRIHTVSASPA